MRRQKLGRKLFDNISGGPGRITSVLTFRCNIYKGAQQVRVVKMLAEIFHDNRVSVFVGRPYQKLSEGFWILIALANRFSRLPHA